MGPPDYVAAAGARAPAPAPTRGVLPPVPPWGWDPLTWAPWTPGMEMLPGLGWWRAAPYGMPWYGSGYEPPPPPRRPRESPTYGAAGDEAVRHWARRHGYDAGYAIRRHFPPRYRAGG